MSKKLRMSVICVALLCVLVVGLTLAGCKDKGDGTYTYKEYISASPTTWNSHIGTSDADSYVQQYTEIGLYDVTLNEARTSYAFIDEMATGDPVDVTADYVGQYGIAEGETGKAFKINLNQSATWANGAAITSADYTYSMEQLLSPKMKNTKASRFIDGTAEIYNAYNFYMSSDVTVFDKIHKTEVLTDAELKALFDAGQLYFSVNTGSGDPHPVYGAARTIAAYHEWALGRAEAGNENFIKLFHKDKDMSNPDLYDTVLSQFSFNTLGYVQVTSENYDKLKDALSVIAPNLAAGEWYNLLSVGKFTSTEYTKITDTTEYTDDEINALIAKGVLYISVNTGISDPDPTYGPARTIKEYHEWALEKQEAGNENFIKLFHKDKDMENPDVYEALDAMGCNLAGYLKITAANVEQIKDTLGVFATNLGKPWYRLCSIKAEVEVPPTTFEEVGLKADGDNAIVIVFVNSLSKFDVKYSLITNWLVYKDLYDAGKATIGNLLTTDYGTSTEKYMAYGPYTLTSYQKDKELVFERNQNWYGYKEDATNYHAGQYQTDRIVAQVINKQETALLEFENGNLDQVKLVSNDLDKYKFSDYLLKRTGGNIWQIAFNGDAEKLAGIEADGEGNRRILAIPEFRKALSLSINREVIGREIAAGSAPAYSYINNNYYYDMENNSESVYRTSEDGMKAIVELYGIEYGEGKQYATLAEAFAGVTGYDIEQARANFVTACDKAIQQGLYTEGSKIKINIYTNDLNATRSAIGQNIQSQVNAATKGTKLENKVFVEFKEQKDGRGEAIRDGKIEASFYSAIADYGDPYAFLGIFTDAEKNTLYECGFDPKTQVFSITYDFNGDGEAETVEDTYYNWQKSIIAGGKYASNVNARLFVLAKLENKLLANFQTIPLYVGTDVMLYSKKVNYATTNANILAVYGGVRLMTYNYTDGEWEKYCKKNSLDYAS